MKVVSFFSGCGGLDLGFEQAGFEVIWANDNDPAVFETYLLNHPHTYLCRKDMRELTMEEIPECDGFIGGPPCQSWGVVVNPSVVWNDLDNGEVVKFFAADGKYLGSTVAANGAASYAVSESLVIAKVGKDSIKIAMK